MNKHAIVILYAGSDKDPGYDVIESLANIIVAAGLSVPELIEIKHFDSDSISKAIIAKSATCKHESAESELMKQSIVYIVEKYKHLPDNKKATKIVVDALRYYHDQSTEDAIAFKKAVDTITSNPTNAVKMGMGKKYVDMVTHAYEIVYLTKM